VLIGGTNRAYRMTPALTHALAERLAALARVDGAGLAITPSRRTGAENLAILKERLSGLPAVIWEFCGENPYFGFLGLADAILVTADSVNMVSEAASTGKPVLVAALEGGNAKFRAFHESMRNAGHTRPFQGRLERWQPPPLDETGRVAAEVKRRLFAAVSA
jgi:mitochondrial fission protein ELM1